MQAALNFPSANLNARATVVPGLRVVVNSGVAVHELGFGSGDGTALFYRHWPAIQPGVAKRAVILLHRGHEHSGRVAHLVEGLNLPDCDFFAWDQRGHGKSPGARGHADNFGVLIADLESFVRHVEREHGVAQENIVIVAASVASVIALAWVHDYAPRIRALVCASPALAVKLYVPFALPLLRAGLTLGGPRFVQSYVKSKLLTHDVARQQSYDADPLISKQIAANILVGLFDTAQRVLDDAAAITTPTLILTSGNDWVVEEAPQKRLFEVLGASVKRHAVLPGFYHDTFGEKDAHVPLGMAREFIVERFAVPLAAPALLAADAQGHTKAEFDALRAPLHALSPKGIYYAMTRASMRLLGSRLSDGMKLGVATGFDSGATLDYVYRNQAQGKTALGRMIDRNYLEAIGWRGIRVRRINLETALTDTMMRVAALGRPVRILDIATGHGRYVLETLKRHPKFQAQAVLRDFSQANIAQGRELAAQLGVSNVRYEWADAFDAAQVAAISPRPSIAIVSGLYELFPQNALVRESLRGLAEAVEPGGYLIYTSQPYHPQVELIARVLSSHRVNAQGVSQPWVMRRRAQGEMDQLVAAAGFTKISQAMDQWGIFGVSVAQRCA